MHALDRCVTDTTLGHIDDAFESEIIVGGRRDLEISQGIADFLALIEARTADDAIGDAQRDETVLEGAHREGGAHQYRHVIELLALALQALYVVADGAGFLIAIPMRPQDQLLAVLALGLERLAETALILGDQP